MTGKKILIIEDEQDIIELVSHNLEREGFTVLAASSGETGLARARADAPDLVLLDLMLPGIDGLEVCRRLKAEENTRRIPVIMLTARDEDVDIVTGLELGAADYVTKPFSPRVLLARVRRILRREPDNQSTTKGTVTVGEITIEPGRHQVTVGGTLVDLTHTEFMLLSTLARRPGWVFSRSQLIDELRDGQHVITDRAIDVQVANLRKKIGQHGDHIETIRGVGYRLRETS